MKIILLYGTFLFFLLLIVLYFFHQLKQDTADSDWLLDILEAAASLARVFDSFIVSTPVRAVVIV